MNEKQKRANQLSPKGLIHLIDMFKQSIEIEHDFQEARIYLAHDELDDAVFILGCAKESAEMIVSLFKDLEKEFNAISESKDDAND